MPKDPHLAAYEREFEPGGHDPYEGYSWGNRYVKGPPAKKLTGKAWVAAGCAGLALGIVLAAVA